jgi:hypothetical protein
MRIVRLACLAALTVSAAACETKHPSGATPSLTASVAISSAPDAKGLAARTNDPAIVAAVRKALECPWDAESLGFDAACLDLNPSLLPAPTTAASTVTFVSLLEDPDVKVRCIASARFEAGLRETWSTDVALARRIVAAAAAERLNHRGVISLGVALAAIDYAQTGLWPAAKAALEATPLARLRIAALERLLYDNEANQDVWDWVKARAVGTDPGEASVALLALTRPTTRKEEACKVLLGHMADDRLGGDAFLVMTLQSSRCTAFADEALAAIQARIKAGARGDGLRWPEGLLQLLQNPDAAAVQRKRAAQVLGSIALSPKVDPSVRVEAVRDLAEVDEAQGRALATRIFHDKDERVIAAAKEMLAPKK